MTREDIIDNLRSLSNRTYSYVILAGVFGPLVLRLLGLSALAPLVRPLALAVVLGGMYARQTRP